MKSLILLIATLTFITPAFADEAADEFEKIEREQQQRRDEEERKTQEELKKLRAWKEQKESETMAKASPTTPCPTCPEAAKATLPPLVPGQPRQPQQAAQQNGNLPYVYAYDIVLPYRDDSRMAGRTARVHLVLRSMNPNRKPDNVVQQEYLNRGYRVEDFQPKSAMR